MMWGMVVTEATLDKVIGQVPTAKMFKLVPEG